MRVIQWDAIAERHEELRRRCPKGQKWSAKEHWSPFVGIEGREGTLL